MSAAAGQLRLAWYRREGEGDDVGSRWLDACAAHLPAAHAERYGDAEPLRGRADAGDAAFLAARRTAEPLLHFVASRPVLDGALAGRHPSYWGPVVGDSLRVELSVLDDPDATARLQAFFVAVAAGRLFASASLGGGSGPPEEPYLAALGTWLGLPPRRPVWSWFGPDYVRRVQGVPGLRASGDGLLLDGPGTDWVPERLQARPEEVEPARRVAGWVPRPVRRSPWRGFLPR